MKLEEAIEVIELNLNAAKKQIPKDTTQALNLGIAALRAVKDGRTDNYCAPIPTLPGETKD